MYPPICSIPFVENKQSVDLLGWHHLLFPGIIAHKHELDPCVKPTNSCLCMEGDPREGLLQKSQIWTLDTLFPGRSWDFLLIQIKNPQTIFRVANLGLSDCKFQAISCFASSCNSRNSGFLRKKKAHKTLELSLSLMVSVHAELANQHRT